ncbi:hypothetical protein KM043_013582 [Ampulex compressa]|nr:hypothetical protein KM043_013582 [Ampulex compressa]
MLAQEYRSVRPVRELTLGKSDYVVTYSTACLLTLALALPSSKLRLSWAEQDDRLAESIPRCGRGVGNHRYPFHHQPNVLELSFIILTSRQDMMHLLLKHTPALLCLSQHLRKQAFQLQAYGDMSKISTSGITSSSRIASIDSSMRSDDKSATSEINAMRNGSHKCIFAIKKTRGVRLITAI